MLKQIAGQTTGSSVLNISPLGSAEGVGNPAPAGAREAGGRQPQAAAGGALELWMGGRGWPCFTTVHPGNREPFRFFLGHPKTGMRDKDTISRRTAST